MLSRLLKRPGLFLIAGLVLTLAGARLINFAFPRHHMIWGLRIHHYVYGIFALSVAGYLALVFKGPRATFWIGLLYAVGLGLTFDEFTWWYNPQAFGPRRHWNWSWDGVLVLGAGFLTITALRMAARWRRRTSSASVQPPAPVPSADPETDSVRSNAR